jgi:hypothetical protein
MKRRELATAGPPTGGQEEQLHGASPSKKRAACAAAADAGGLTAFAEGLYQLVPGQRLEVQAGHAVLVPFEDVARRCWFWQQLCRHLNRARLLRLCHSSQVLMACDARLQVSALNKAHAPARMGTGCRLEAESLGGSDGGRAASEAPGHPHQLPCGGHRHACSQACTVMRTQTAMQGLWVNNPATRQRIQRQGRETGRITLLLCSGASWSDCQDVSGGSLSPCWVLGAQLPAVFVALLFVLQSSVVSVSTGGPFVRSTSKWSNPSPSPSLVDAAQPAAPPASHHLPRRPCVHTNATLRVPGSHGQQRGDAGAGGRPRQEGRCSL